MFMYDVVCLNTLDARMTISRDMFNYILAIKTCESKKINK